MVIFIVLIAFIFSQQKKTWIVYKSMWKKKDFYKVIMPSEDTKTLKFNQYQKN